MIVRVLIRIIYPGVSTPHSSEFDGRALRFDEKKLLDLDYSVRCEMLVWSSSYFYDGLFLTYTNLLEDKNHVSHCADEGHVK